MKYTGIGLIAVSLSMTGIFASGLLRIRLRTVDSVVLFISLLNNELSFNLSTLGEAVEKISAYPSLARLDFLSECSGNVSRGTDFPQAWEKALSESRCILKKEERLSLIQMGEGLSSSDSEGQKRIFGYYKSYFDGVRLAAADNSRKYSGLICASGFMASALVAVILF